MTEQTEARQVGISLSIFMDGEWLVEQVTAENVENPAVVMSIAVNPDKPNSFAEFEAVTSVFSEEFMAIAADAMNKFIAKVASDLPDGMAEKVEEEVKEAMVLQGFTPDDVEAMTSPLGAD